MDETEHKMTWGKYCILAGKITYFFESRDYLYYYLGNFHRISFFGSDPLIY
jgi:hypothetical protein